MEVQKGEFSTVQQNRPTGHFGQWVNAFSQSTHTT